MNQTNRARPRQSPRPLLWPLAIAGLVAAAASVGAQSQNSVAEISVEFHDDDMGFNVTSSKDLSNIIVEYCDGSTSKTEFPDDGNATQTYTHNDTQVIVGVWVKSGSFQDPNGPPGAGERFENEGVECEPIPVFPTVLAGVAATTMGAGAYLWARRRR